MHDAGYQTSPHRRFLHVQSARDEIIKERNDSQNLWSLTEWCIPSDHLPGPHIPQEPADMTNSTPDQVARGSLPRATNDP